jgi:hypothetical protein
MRKVSLTNLRKKDISEYAITVIYKGYKIIMYKDFNGYITYKCHENPNISGNHYSSIESVIRDIREEA